VTQGSVNSANVERECWSIRDVVDRRVVVPWSRVVLPVRRIGEWPSVQLRLHWGALDGLLLVNLSTACEARYFAVHSIVFALFVTW
jgi:hypothetical protein